MARDQEKLRKIIRRTMDLYAYAQAPSEECPIFPDHIHIEPTNACNLRCVHCHQSSVGTHFTKARGLMDYDLYVKLIDQIADLSERITLDSHGEPTQHPRIVDMVAYATSKGLSVSMLTNATRLDDSLSAALLDAGLNRIVFSFEGSTREVHERTRRRSRFYPTLRNILSFLRQNDERGHPTFVCMSMVKSSYTAEDVDSYRDYFGRLPVDTIFVNPLLNLSDGSPLGEEKDVEDLKKSGVATAVCRMPWMNMGIGWDGLISPCIVDYNESHIVGDANVTPLRDIWNDAGYRRFRRCHLTGDMSWIEAQGPLCASCNIPHDPDYDEYDLMRMADYSASYILRQAQVHLVGEEVDPRPWTERPTHAFCLDELARVGDLLASPELTAPPAPIRASDLRATAKAGARSRDAAAE